jgi:hypothetical protein
MKIYLVTSKITEKNSTGILLKASMKCHGVFTGEYFASKIADKYDANVVELILDKDYDPQDNIVLQQWLNPGYFNG